MEWVEKQRVEDGYARLMVLDRWKKLDLKLSKKMYSRFL